VQSSRPIAVDGNTDRRATRHLATRNEILEQAWALSRERGLTGWTLRDVADAVGMRAPSLYVYFAGKSDLYDGMYADGQRALLAALESSGVVRGGPGTAARTRLRRGALVFFDFCVSDPARYQLMFQRTLPGFAPSPESYELARHVLAVLEQGLADAGVRGRRRVDLWTAVLTGLVSQQVSNDPGGRRWRRLVPAAVDLLLASPR
jgi:AcrR family transcriptional regulator